MHSHINYMIMESALSIMLFYTITCSIIYCTTTSSSSSSTYFEIESGKKAKTKAFNKEDDSLTKCKAQIPKSLMFNYYYHYQAINFDISISDIKYIEVEPTQRHETLMFSDDISKNCETCKKDALSNVPIDSLYTRSIEGIEEMLGQVEHSGSKVLERLSGVMTHMVHSKDQMLKRLDKVMDRVSESVLESKDRVIKGLDSVMDKMSESKSMMMEEIDYVLDNLAHSKVITDIKALPGEIKESFLLSVRNKSYIAAGVLVATTTAVLIAGALYYAWCHQDTWNYSIVPIEELPHSKSNVITHVGIQFADGSAVSKGITSCFVSKSSNIINMNNKHI
ncbi:hypothetical protein Bpfe_018171 [Biomphalaria pfeifferi]|uniref:Uncharacterized protein n=1 Tax=Biomphalaria pfeifferi TaxID=112525 RepID=A0AAD8F6P9_BIOPF|nr:hypothetical protein Bpfe_018171 [Biomphalaria pfeifferi]